MKPHVDQPENPLFTNGENTSLNACVGENGGPYDLFDYGRGFFEGGHAIVTACEAFKVAVDVAVYPIAFLYRHGVELYLKHLVITLQELSQAEFAYKKIHGMNRLWSAVLDLNAPIKEALIAPAEVERAGLLIGHFDAFDPSGQVFRYPEDIRGNRHLAEHKLINVDVLRGQMLELQDILERWYYAADAQIIETDRCGQDGTA